MAFRFPPNLDEADPPLLLADDPAIVSAAQAAMMGLGRLAPQRVASGREALHHLLGGDRPRRLVCQPSAAGSSWPALLATARDPLSSAGIVVVLEDGPPIAGINAVLPRAADLAAALSLPEPVAMASTAMPFPLTDPAELASGLARGEFMVRYQPILRVADRRPVLLEGLARWHRHTTTPVGPELFIPLAESSGQARALTEAVACAAFREMATAPARLGASISLNLPLALLLERDVLPWLRGMMAGQRFPASALILELTETTPVRDRPALRRALRRLEAAGVPVLIDDMGLEDDRAALMELPFAGIKLDRHLVGALPGSRRARAEVERLIRHAHRRRMTVTAEGVSDSRLWRAAAMAGADHVQGYAVSRPLSAAALAGWASAWRGKRPHGSAVPRRSHSG
ncbi:EAL domain-containing protein [Teichococcus oryzae]|uniref:EAL domain-containing protein n=1 Tax=Teichococcus oryzae TaxID=1608942 RepID=A0A5B2TMD1_9PROT|nr:EAL domain-containing protein [Pseudoroseomonas oryzae]KAA2214870.1 EAL domain-containing protein [Pseudoroseomonas oryzae]